MLIPTECQRGDLSRILPTTGSEKAPCKQSFLWVASIASSDARSTSTGPLGSGCAPTGPGGYSPERLMLCLMTYHGQGVPGSSIKGLLKIINKSDLWVRNYVQRKGRRHFIAALNCPHHRIAQKKSPSPPPEIIPAPPLNWLNHYPSALQQLTSNVNRKTCLQLKIPIKGETVRQRERILLE